MNSFENQGLDEDAFGDKGISSLRTFDAFREYSQPQHGNFYNSCNPPALAIAHC